MVKGEETEANQIFQLAINKDGILRGNYYDALSDSTLPVVGSVDKKSQRAAWTVGDRKETVYETGVGNLTEAGNDDARAFRQGPHAAMDADPAGRAAGSEISSHHRVPAFYRDRTTWEGSRTLIVPTVGVDTDPRQRGLQRITSPAPRDYFDVFHPGDAYMTLGSEAVYNGKPGHASDAC